MTQYLAETFAIAQKRGWIKPDIDLVALSYFFQGVFIGHILLDITNQTEYDERWSEIAFKALQPFLTDKDPWLGQTVTKAALAEIVGAQILEYLKTREATLAALYAEIFRIASASGVAANTFASTNSLTVFTAGYLVVEAASATISVLKFAVD